MRHWAGGVQVLHAQPLHRSLFQAASCSRNVSPPKRHLNMLDVMLMHLTKCFSFVLFEAVGVGSRTVCSRVSLGPWVCMCTPAKFWLPHISGM